MFYSFDSFFHERKILGGKNLIFFLKRGSLEEPFRSEAASRSFSSMRDRERLYWVAELPYHHLLGFTHPSSRVLNAIDLFSTIVVKINFLKYNYPFKIQLRCLTSISCMN